MSFYFCFFTFYCPLMLFFSQLQHLVSLYFKQSSQIKFDEKVDLLTELQKASMRDCVTLCGVRCSHGLGQLQSVQVNVLISFSFCLV